MQATPVLKVSKIAVLRANALGDFIFSLPALRTLRNVYLGAEIVLLGRAMQVELLSGRSTPVDRVIEIPRMQGVHDDGPYAQDGELAGFFKRMRREQFDIGIQLHGGGRHSNPVVARLGARVTAGTRTPDAVPLDRWVLYVYNQREVLLWLEVVSLVGASTSDIRPHLEVEKNDVG